MIDIFINTQLTSRLILVQHLIDTRLTSQFKLNQESIDNLLCAKQLICIIQELPVVDSHQLLTEISIKCGEIVNQGVIGLSIKG